ncbi:hypothetical protein [Inmirania thermothiophila]|uniref:Phosphoglycerate mutase n=1 Tax=Inmirania thermothiophila TaxID=1750597 RepID=A0A3N1XZV6_9GAMM|nr:hypothetical protein [Inmirania thermothiophila]ROR32110.1 hypothetical protein EDC57_1301 [Inmirania thermothiophila]
MGATLTLFVVTDGPPPQGLRRLLRGARRRRSPESLPEAALCRLFGREPGAGLAALGAAAELPGVEAGGWLRCDPVHLLPDMTALRLFWGRGLGLHEAEARSLAAAAEPAFADLGGRLHVAAPHRWYLALAGPAELAAAPPRALHGTDIARALPEGPGALAWHRRLNEAQTLLHAHPVNQARRTRGLPEINGLWPWGGGAGGAVRGRWAVVGSGGWMASVLGRAAGARVCAPEEAVTAALHGEDALAVLWPGEELAGEPLRWEETPVAPAVARLRAAVRRGALGLLEVVAPGAGVWRLGRLGAWLGGR